MTLANVVAQTEWWFYEKGGQSIWNLLKRISESTIPATLVSGGGVTLGTTLYGALDTVNTNHFGATAGSPNTGAPLLLTFNAPGWAYGQQQNPPPAGIRPPTLDQP